MGPTQLAEVLRHLPRTLNPNLLVGFETSDDAGVFRLPTGQALVQTVDFFTPIVDDPYAYGQIAAANALSDVYAMGGDPITVLNIACFDPTAQPPEVWADVLRGAYDKTTEAGAVVAGGHSVQDSEPKFGMAVTGLVDPERMLTNDRAQPGDQIWLTKPLGTGILTTAAKRDLADPEALRLAIETMATLNRAAKDLALSVGARCATDITGFGLAGHLWNVARASGVQIVLQADALPLLPTVVAMIEAGMTTGGGRKNREFLGENLRLGPGLPAWLADLVVDPQTSGGLAVFSREVPPGATLIGECRAGEAGILVQ